MAVAARLIGWAVAVCFALGAGIAVAADDQSDAARKRLVFFSLLSDDEPRPCVDGFLTGLASGGLQSGRDFDLLLRSPMRGVSMPEMARELVALNPDVIVLGSNRLLLELRDVTTSVPIVTLFGQGLLTLGLVASYDKPGTNVTGQSIGESELFVKMLDLLLRTVPARRVAILLNRQNPLHVALERQGRFDSCRGCEARVVWFDGPEQIDAAWRSAAARRADAVLVAPDILAYLAQHARLATELRLPAISHSAEFVNRGGLMSYGYESLASICTDGARYVSRIFEGIKPQALPVEQLIEIELTLNLKAAKRLGVRFPETVMLRANRRVR